MGEPSGSEMISGWPDDSKEAAQIVIETYGEPPEVTQTQLTWHNVGAWKRWWQRRRSMRTTSRLPTSTASRHSSTIGYYPRGVRIWRTSMEVS